MLQLLEGKVDSDCQELAHCQISHHLKQKCLSKSHTIKQLRICSAWLTYGKAPAIMSKVFSIDLKCQYQMVVHDVKVH